MSLVADSLAMYGRLARNLARQPIWILILLVQPLFWLLLYSQLFRRITDLPGFGTDSYIQFLTPGIVIMTAFFSAIWSGMGMIEDLERGVVERFLATPAARSSLILGHVLMSATTALVQTLIILGIGLAMGARVEQGAPGWLVILLAGALVGACFAGLSHGIALLTRREETMIAVANFIGLPLVFVSSTLITTELMPGWMRSLATVNPVNWGVEAAREAVEESASWGRVAVWLALLVAAAAVTTAFATWAFRAFRRTL